MKKGFLLFIFAFVVCADSLAAQYKAKTFNTITSHNDVYPYVLNNTKQNSSYSTTTASGSVNSAPVGRRNVAQRKNNARAATSTQPKTSTATTSQTRRVVQRTNTTARAGTNNTVMRTNTAQSTANTRGTTSLRTRATTGRTATTTTVSTTSTEKVSSQRCFSDYKECMEGYCKREDTAYNRCYCSAKLAQIDATYQNKIDALIQQIIKLQYSTDATSDDIKEYWNQTVGTYTGDNPWVNIENALNIEWADTQSRVRGQNAFNTGHQYCVQHLRACSYMSTNMRDAYKSEIARDCETYEKSLQKIQDAAESVIESYND